MEEILENAEELHELLRVRREKLEELKGAGKNPYEITKYDVNAESVDIKKEFERLEAEKGEELGEHIKPQEKSCGVFTLSGGLSEAAAPA